jgi:YidC/Oxa1 family membrane protein insertase
LDNQRNLLLAVALCGLLLLGWEFAIRAIYPAPPEPPATEHSAAPAAAKAGKGGKANPAAGSGAGLDDGAEARGGRITLASALKPGSRIAIETPRVTGSINLVGARIDDLELKDYRETVGRDSAPVRLLAPERTDNEYFAEFGFVVDGKRIPSSAVWQADGKKLSPATPVTLIRADKDGTTYSIKLSIDQNYMITAQQTVANRSDKPAIVQPFALIKRRAVQGVNTAVDQFVMHVGPVGVFGETLWDPHSFPELAEIGSENPQGKPDWLGFTDHYWHTVLIPGQGDIDKAEFRSLGQDRFVSGLVYEPVTLAAGAKAAQTTRLFAGAKESVLLDQYEAGGISLFGKAISWGWFEWFEKPFLWLLRTLNGLIGNFGLAIIILTFIIRGLMFPIAQKQFASMAQMKAVQPKMKAIQDRYKDDKQRQQQEIMKLYKDEKVNPLAGCLPLIIQIPIFFALYKVLVLAIEMRHEPFIPFWIKDLSAPDPWHILNLFGALPFDVPAIIAIGPLAVLLGLTMWLTFKLNPSAMDPVQQQVFSIMPWVLMFVMAPFAAGLLIYWVTSNILTLAQQKYLYSKHPQLKAQAEKDKAEMARKIEREKAEKSGA